MKISVDRYTYMINNMTWEAIIPEINRILGFEKYNIKRLHQTDFYPQSGLTEIHKYLVISELASDIEMHKVTVPLGDENSEQAIQGKCNFITYALN